jgi:hypothetical protein
MFAMANAQEDRFVSILAGGPRATMRSATIIEAVRKDDTIQQLINSLRGKHGISPVARSMWVVKYEMPVGIVARWQPALHLTIRQVIAHMEVDEESLLVFRVYKNP